MEGVFSSGQVIVDGIAIFAVQEAEIAQHSDRDVHAVGEDLVEVSP